MNNNYSPLTEEIIKYNKSKPNSQLHKKLEKEILNKVRLLVYFAYKKNSKIREEDAANFLFFFEPKLIGIIKHFTYEKISFECYMISIIQKRISGFYYTKNKESQKSIDYNIYLKNFPEHFISPPKNNNYYFSKFSSSETVKEAKISYNGTSNEENSLELYPVSNSVFLTEEDRISVIYKLNLVLQESKTWRRRIIAYFLSLSCALRKDNLDNFLAFCNINKVEFYSLLILLEDNQKKVYSTLDKQKDAICSNFSRYLRIEKENATAAKSLNYIPTPEDLEKLKRTKKHLNDKLIKFKELHKTIPQSTLSKLLKIPRSTLSTDLFFVKLLLKVCIKPEVPERKKLGSLINKVLNNPDEYYHGYFKLISPYEAINYKQSK